MKADVESPAEKAALEWATEFFRSRSSHLTPKGSRENLHKIHQQIATTWFDKAVTSPEDKEERLTEMLANALYGDEFDTAGLCELVIEFHRLDKPLPWQLKMFAVFRLRWPDYKWNRESREGKGWGFAAEVIKRKPGPRRYDMMLRNGSILTAILCIAKRYGLQATRNTATKDSGKRPSAASIVRKALELGGGVKLREDAINKIWNENREAFLNHLQSEKII